MSEKRSVMYAAASNSPGVPVCLPPISSDAKTATSSCMVTILFGVCWQETTKSIINPIITKRISLFLYKITEI